MNKAVANARSSSSPQVNILGVGVSAINLPMALAIIDAWINRREPHYLTVTPAHAVWDGHHHDP